MQIHLKTQLSIEFKTAKNCDKDPAQDTRKDKDRWGEESTGKLGAVGTLQRLPATNNINGATSVLCLS